MDAMSVGIERRVHDGERRRYTLRTLWGALRQPRRLQGRRTLDRRFAVLDRVEPGVAWLGVLLVSLSIMDAVFTLTLIGRGGSELNPVMNAVMQHGVAAFLAVKMLLTAVPALLLVATANVLLFGRFRARSLLAALTGLYGGLIAYELLLLSL